MAHSHNCEAGIILKVHSLIKQYFLGSRAVLNPLEVPRYHEAVPEFGQVLIVNIDSAAALFFLYFIFFSRNVNHMGHK